jgi:hypothetical protein
VPEFDHYAPSNWLLRNPQILEADTKDVRKTLELAQQAFDIFSKLVQA